MLILGKCPKYMFTCQKLYCTYCNIPNFHFVSAGSILFDCWFDISGVISSGHIISGDVSANIGADLLAVCSWGENIYFIEDDCNNLGSIVMSVRGFLMNVMKVFLRFP